MDDDGSILCILVVGFHHKKGCQLEYSYPALVPSFPTECPPGWKYLPTLALPDGSHNYEEDTVFFHIPSLTKPRHTIFGISCFRQIPVEKIRNRTADMTRGTVQKSVCILSKLPVYGQIQVKLALITQAYFDGGDFSEVTILQEAYHNFNTTLYQHGVSPDLHLGLPARDFLLQWKHKALLLFKLLLLEKKVIFYKSPVHSLTCIILTLTSLFPDMIENGLNSSACLKLSRPMSPMPQFSDDDNSQNASPIKSSHLVSSSGKPTTALDNTAQIFEYCDNTTTNIVVNDVSKVADIGVDLIGNEAEKKDATNSKVSTLTRDLSSETVSDDVHRNNMTYLNQLSTISCGFPLHIFTKGYLNLPYLSLPYMDLLNDVNVRGYVLGATNVLFKQKKQLYDVLIDADHLRIECPDADLRRQLHLTTEDLRFADYIVKHVTEDKQDVFLDGIGWEGGDEWIRAQFRSYLLSLLRTSFNSDDNRSIEPFNLHFIHSWKETHNYKIWSAGVHPGILDVNPSHPFAGQLSVADMKLRLTHTIQNTDGGRKLNQAMVSTSKVMATTSKTVGNAISNAKGALSNWWNNLVINPEATVNRNHSSNNGDSITEDQIGNSPDEETVHENYQTGQIHTV